MSIWSIILVVKDLVMTPNLTMVFINLFIFILTRIIIFFIFLLQPKLYKMFGAHACSLLEWSAYLLFTFDAYVTSLTLSYFFYKFDLQFFVLLNFVYFLVYFFFHSCSKLNKQFYFTMLLTPCPARYSRNNNLNVPPAILHKTWSPSVQVIVTNLIYTFIQFAMLITLFKYVFKVFFKDDKIL